MTLEQKLSSVPSDEVYMLSCRPAHVSSRPVVEQIGNHVQQDSPGVPPSVLTPTPVIGVEGKNTLCVSYSSLCAHVAGQTLVLDAIAGGHKVFLWFVFAFNTAA